jgi:uncharacterized protein YcaQ
MALAAQGLLAPSSKPATKRAVLEQIRRMGALQIDTISVVARSPYLVLWSRLGDYTPAWLDQLLAAGQLFEYWAHAACFLPIEDYRFYRRRMVDGGNKWFNLKQHPEMEAILASIRANGPMRSVEFETDAPRVAGWWEWKPAKRALEALFNRGDLMIARRESFHRVYDLRERILPDWDDACIPSAADTLLHFTEKAVRALGITTAEWAADYFRYLKKESVEAAQELVDRGILIYVAVDGWKRPGVIHVEHLKLLRQARAGRLIPTATTLLSPFDPLVWDRSRALEMFGFDYRIECYTPEAKRRYGYFTLPLLHRGRLVGRLDAKAHRRDGLFEVKVVHLEPGVEPSGELAADLAATIQRLADWHATPAVTVNRSDPARFRGLLSRAIKQCVKNPDLTNHVRAVGANGQSTNE